MQGIEQFLDGPTRNLVSIPLTLSKPPISAVTTTNAVSFFLEIFRFWAP
jgi:hypothetical protein